MIRDKIKKILALSCLLSMIVVSSMISGQASNAKTYLNEVQTLESTTLHGTKLDDEEYIYGPYEVYNTEDEIIYMLEQNFITKDEADLQINFLNSNSDEEKEMIYQSLMDLYVREGRYTSDEGDLLKGEGYKNHYKNIDIIYYREFVKSGYITQEQADLIIEFNSTETKESREEVFDKIMDTLLNNSEFTSEQINRLKEGGYEKYYDNKDIIYYEQLIKELEQNNYIDTYTSKILVDDVSNEDTKINISNLYQKYLIDKAIENGEISKELGDIEKEFIDLNYDEYNEEEYLRLYDRYIEQLIKDGVISKEDLEQELQPIILY